MTPQTSNQTLSTIQPSGHREPDRQSRVLVNFSGLSSRSLLGKALRLPLRLIPSGAVVRIMQGPLRGKRWIASSSNHGLWLGSYECDKQRAFAAAIRPGDTVYDLGANVGFYSLLASILVGPSGRVFSFEPVHRNLGFLRRHLELNDISNCTIVEAAVSNSEGTAHFALGVSASEGHLAAAQETAFQVRTVTLDGLIATGRISPPKVMKCDIEGAEYDALLGAAETLRRHAPVVFLATHGPDVHRRCCGFLSDLGYNLSSLDDRPIDSSSEILAVQEQNSAALKPEVNS